MKKASLKKRRPQKVHAKPNAKLQDLHLLSPEFLQSREDDAENLMGLERMLLWAQGFALAFARVNMPSQRAELVKEIRRRVEPKGIIIIEIDLHEPVRDLLAEIDNRIRKMYLIKPKEEKRKLAVAEAGPRFAIFVYGLEYSIPSSEIYHPALAVMNYKRENFRAQISGPLVLWVPEYALQAIIEGAPDFWAWRSGVFEFTLSQEMIGKAWLAVKPERDQIELERMTLEEKRNRIQLLSGLLTEYEVRRDADFPEITAIRMDLQNRIGMLYYMLGDYDHALGFFKREHKIAEESNNKVGIAISMQNIGIIHQERGDYAAALAEFEKSLKIYKTLGDRASIATSLHQLGMIHHSRGDYEVAMAEYEKALKIKEALGDRASIANSLHQIGMIYYDRGDYAAALEHYEKSLKIRETLGDHAGIADSLHQIGMIYYDRGDYAAALEHYEKSLKIKEGLGDRAGVARSLHNIGAIHQDRGDYAAALEQYQKSLKIAEKLGNRAGIARSLHNIGVIHYVRGNYTVALVEHEKALQIFEELGNRADLAKSLHQIGMIHQARGDYAVALEHYEKSLKIKEGLGDRAGVASSRGQIGKLFTQIGYYGEAFAHLLVALITFVELQSPDAGITVNVLKNLRAKWGAENFDAAWQKATSEAIPKWIS
jgi:tetratricopeptide (TPR) repeat protein